MTYQQERERTIADLARDGMATRDITRILRQATTLHRLAEAQCNGDYPYANGSEWSRSASPSRLKICPECADEWAKTAFRKGVCPDCRAQAIVRAIVATYPGWTVAFGGDPRGCVLHLGSPAHPYDECGKNGHRGIGIPGRY